MKPGRLGVWYSTDKLDGPQLRDFVRTVEKNGYSNLWYPESRGYESMSLAAWLLSCSEKLGIGSSIANIYARDSFTAQRAVISLNALHGGRFILGLGVSHIPMVEGLRGHRYDKPLSAMSAYLDGINKSAPAGELPVVVAALGPKMLEVAGRLADGTATWMTGVQTLADHTVPTINKAAKDAGKPAPRVIAALPFALTTDVERAKTVANQVFAIYGQLPSYRAMLDREGAANPADVGLYGDESALRAGLARLREAGVTHFLASVFGPDAAALERTRQFLKSEL